MSHSNGIDMQISDRSKMEIEVELIKFICILDRGPRYERFMNEFSEIVSTWRNLHLHCFAHINNGWCSGKAKYICNPTALGFDLNFWSLIIWFVMHDKDPLQEWNWLSHNMPIIYQARYLPFFFVGQQSVYLLNDLDLVSFSFIFCC